MASIMGGHDGLGDGLGVAVATGADTAIDEWPPVGTAALTELNWKAAPTKEPRVIPPVMAATFVIFIVAGTTRAPHELVRNQPMSELCITNWAYPPFQGLRPRRQSRLPQAQKKVVCSATRRW